MHIRHMLPLLLALLGAWGAKAQYNLPQNRIWAMGNRVGLDFSNLASPTPISTSLANSSEGAASVCDTNGQLLFYTHGGTVWNRNGAIMPHGSNLIGFNNGSTISTTQGALIVPMPGNASRYYLFSLTAVSNCKLFCNVIDMSKDGGLGDVDTTFALRHQSLADSFLTEKMTAVAGCNNNVWVVVHTQNSPVFRAYEVTAAGINLTPVLSAVGNFPGANYQQGVIKFSPDRTRLLSCNFRATQPTSSGIEVFSFDYSTGILSNAVTLDNASYYGGTFAPGSKLVYAGSTATMNSGMVYQWDLSAANPPLSKTQLGPCGQYADMKLGPDGRIYFGALAGSPGYSNYRFMGRINSPDSAGTACQFKDTVTALSFPNPSNANNGLLLQGLPNDVAVPMANPAADQHLLALDTTICGHFQGLVLAAPAGYLSRSWNNGDTSIVRNALQRGTYWVRSVSACGIRVDTFVLRGADMPALSVSYTAPLLTATAGFASYQWYRNGQVIAGATSNTFNAVQNGVYSVAANYGGGCKDSAAYTVTGAASVAQLQAGALAVYPNPARDEVQLAVPVPVTVSVRTLEGREVLRAERTERIRIAALPDGVYLLLVSDADGRQLGVQKLVKAGR